MAKILWVRCHYCGRVGLFPKNGKIPEHKVPEPKGAYKQKAIPLTASDAKFCRGSGARVAIR